jgi:tellurite resistance protein TerC
MTQTANGWLWLGFTLFVVLALSIDTFFLNKRFARPGESIRAALVWSLVWVSLALIFNLLLWLYLLKTQTPAIAHKTALDFFTGYLIEKSLSVDNLFVFYMIFKQMRIPHAYQQRVFTIGIWSAIVLRLLIILAGTWLVSRFHWVLYVMGAFLIFTGIKILVAEEKEKDITESAIIAMTKRIFRVTSELSNQAFFIKKNKLYYATPLFVTLILIEISDIIFAVDSIPAIFAITQDPFIVWSSNIFAILGLRALYFVLSGMIGRFELLKYAISMILVFIGVKMVIEPWVHIDVLVSLAVIAGTLILFTLVSIRREVKAGRK